MENCGIIHIHYRLIGVDGHVLDVNADPRNLDALEGLVKRLVLPEQ